MSAVKVAAPPRMSALAGGVEDGIEWCVVRAPLYGAVNGYARIPEGHPWHALGYDDIPHSYDDPDNGVAVNGGLTFARDGWIGFDTLHAGDRWPGESPHICERIDRPCTCTRWTQYMVEEEAKGLARTVAKAAAR